MIAGLTDLFHTGIIVDDLPIAMNSMTHAFGYEWAEPSCISAPVRLRGQVVEAKRWVTCSIGETHAIELIQQVGGEIYAPLDGSQRLHHLGFWVDDLLEESRRLEGLGMPLTLTGPADAATPYYAFHDGALGGLFIELVSTSRKPDLAKWRTGAPLSI